jgi:hypothetical protein
MKGEISSNKQISPIVEMTNNLNTEFNKTSTNHKS